MNFVESNKLLTQSQKSLVGGVNSPVRSFSKVVENQIFASHANGPYLFDVDGNKYIDLVLSYGPHLFGHSPVELVDAIREQVPRGVSFGMTSEKEIQWAELLVELVPCAEKVRALNSGTEACMTAIRLARGYTGRSLFLKFAGHYHGHVDSMLVDSGSGVATLSEAAVASSAGISEKVASEVRVLPFNDLEKLKSFFEEAGDFLAGVILEPVMGNMGVIPASDEFISLLRVLTKKHGALLIFDEVMTGFRVHEKSAQGAYQVLPDLCCLGKVIGGGMPLAALVGKKEIMEKLSPLGDVYQAGTLSGNPLAMAAGVAMLEKIKNENPLKEMESFFQELDEFFLNEIKNSKHQMSYCRKGTMFNLFFRGKAPQNAEEAKDYSFELFQKFFSLALKNKLMLPPSPFEAYFLSTKILEIKDEFFKSWTAVFRELEEF